MLIGLLECDHVDDKLRYIAGDYSDMFVNLFEQYAPEISLKIYDVQNNHYPVALNECDGYISTGSRYSVYDDEKWIGRFREFVQRLHLEKQKFVGICFGHQMIAEALGGKCITSPNGWNLGVEHVTITKTKSWMKPILENYNLIVSHQDQVVELPPGSTVLGSNHNCSYAMFTVGGHFLGIQAHPEVPLNYLQVSMSERISRIGNDKVCEAKKTLQIETHQQIISRWIKQFFNGK